MNLGIFVTLVGYCCKKDQKAAKTLLLTGTKFYQPIRCSSFVATLSCKNICSIYPAYVLQHQPWKNVCSFHPARYLQCPSCKYFVPPYLQYNLSLQPYQYFCLQVCKLHQPQSHHLLGCQSTMLSLLRSKFLFQFIC